MFSKLFTTVRVFYITCKHSRFQVFSWLIWRNWAKQELEGFGNSKIEQNKSSFSHSVYVSPKAESCTSGLSGWKTKGSFGQAASVISIKHSRISETTKDCVFDLIHDWLVFHVLWVSRLRRDLLIVILYFGLPIDSFCKWKGDFNPLREVVSNLQESGDRKFNFFLFAPKDPYFEPFSKMIFKSSSEFLFWQK